VVSGVEIVQHVNGVTQISGMLDNKSLGTVFGPAGDVTSGFVAGEGESQVFNFANKTVSGKEFKLTITKSNYPTAFAIHRAFPLDSNGSRITPASGPLQGGPVGGLVHGVSGTKEITCSNLTTGQSISFSISHMSWNCEANGLTVRPGDLVEQKALATK